MANAVMKTIAPKLPAPIIADGVAFYRKLGFAPTFQDEGYAVLVRDDVVLHLWPCDDRRIAENTGCYVYVADVDALYAEFQPLGIIHPNDPLQDKPHGMREFSILDPAGNLLTFGQRNTQQ